MERRSKKEEGNFFLYAKFTIFLVYKVLEDDQSCRLLDSRLFLQAKSSSSNLTSLGFSGRKSQDTDHGYSEEQNWIFYFPRGRTSKKGGGGGHVSLFRHVGKMSVLSYQSRSENWGDFFVRALLRMLESNVTVTHYHIAKKFYPFCSIELLQSAINLD